MDLWKKLKKRQKQNRLSSLDDQIIVMLEQVIEQEKETEPTPGKNQ